MVAVTALAPMQARADTSLPAMGEGAEMTTSEERRLGDDIAREIYRDPQFLDDAILYEYVNGIWQELMLAARQRGTLTSELQERFAWQVMLIQDATVNAFALPGGFMGVQTGLVGVVGSRDELASVLAHEMSHITQRHIARMLARQSRMTPVMIAGMILGALAASKNPAAAQALMVGSSAAVIQSQLNFSRDMEREADRTGMSLMPPAGYSQAGFVSMFEKLQQANRMNDNGSWPYLRSHPLTTERIADMQSRLPAGAARKPQDTGMVAQMMSARARVLSKPEPRVLQQWVDLTATAEFAGRSADQQAGGWYLAAMSQSQLGRQAEARTALDQLDRLVQAFPDALREAQLLRADLAVHQRQPQEALAALAALAKMQPAKAQPGKAGSTSVTVSNAMTGLVNDAVITRGSDKSLSIQDSTNDVLLPEVKAVVADDAGRPALMLAAQALAQLPASEVAAYGDVLHQTSSRLQTLVAQWPKDVGAWLALSWVLRQQSQPLRAIRAEAESRAAQYDYAAAVDRLRAGQDMARSSQNRNDYYEASIIDTRLREMQSLAKEQAARK
ncbi:putative Zn-dependent protease [Comamonas sp. BIGb0152]|uniref:M48 family metalloprotease n=1 Tax=Comamonas sp. BIGb0152 TaxID=2940601 RepID=UPI0021699003|nr:M48 family metalloprotease [Comamonas sp. BIGb0152]MCS4294449.1 putative Zn-dependent protease [Comamonas sp. BIGb0152]